MPRIPRERSSLHAPSASKRTFAAQHVDEAIVADDNDEQIDAPADYLLHEFAEPRTKPRPTSTKAAMRRAVLEKQAAASSLPYAISKSAMRRRKRQARDALAGGEGVSSLEAALDDMVDEADAGVGDDEEEVPRTRAVPPPESRRETKVTASKRSRYLADERKRLPAVLQDASFKKDPFGAIRLHAQNTLLPAPNALKRAARQKRQE